MTIDGIQSSPAGSGKAPEIRGTERPGGREESGASQSPIPRGDSVEISAEARGLASEGLDPERLVEIRENIRQGRYDQPGVAEDVARRILASGDVT